MQRNKFIWITLIHLLFKLNLILSINMKQFEESLDSLRGACAPKFKVTIDQLDELRGGKFDENNKELKCYTRCIAQMAGTLTKKGEINPVRAYGQVDILLPPELQDDMRQALDKCLVTQNDYKNSCDKTFYVTKCIHSVNPAKFKFP